MIPGRQPVSFQTKEEDMQSRGSPKRVNLLTMHLLFKEGTKEGGV